MVESKVLLIEDDPAIVENLSAFLKEEGFEVTSTDGQSRALSQIEAKRPDLILLDVTLAQGNGYSTCTAIKARYDIPVIFLTALGDEFSVVTGLDMGADDYSSKPFRQRELVSRRRSVLRR
ncbi:MAG: response regulator, partial [Lachnospiraceae bacterium]|nr:response regulator [Lachnospiraceae bacterium]